MYLGLTCQDSRNHFEQGDLLTPNQLIVLSEMKNHADWDAYADFTADDYFEVGLLSFLYTSFLILRVTKNVSSAY